MKQTLTPLWEASIKSGLSQIELFILIQNRLIKFANHKSGIAIEYNSLREWIGRNRMLYGQLQMDVDLRDTTQHFSKYIRKIRLRRNSKRE